MGAVPDIIQPDKDPVPNEENPFENARRIRAQILSTALATRELFFWSEERVTRRLREVVIRSFRNVLDFARGHDINLRTAS